MKETTMSGIEASAGVAGLVIAKVAFVKAVFGMAGAAVLYLAMPPERPDGTFSRKEFAIRLAVAGFFSWAFSDWAIDVIQGAMPILKAASHPKPFEILTGAPGWWVSRAAALWFYQRKDKNIAELARDIKDEVKS